MPPTKKQKAGASTFFPSVGAIKYKGPESNDPLAFKYYNADEKIMGKPMKDWLRFAVCYWHTWRGNGADPFGIGGTIRREWDGTDMEAALKRVDVHFEFCAKLGIELYCFHDRDVSPEGASVAETEKNFDVVVATLGVLFLGLGLHAHNDHDVSHAITTVTGVFIVMPLAFAGHAKFMMVLGRVAMPYGCKLALASFVFVACVLSLSLANFSLGREFCRATVGYGCLRG